MEHAASRRSNKSSPSCSFVSPGRSNSSIVFANCLFLACIKTSRVGRGLHTACTVKEGFGDNEVAVVVHSTFPPSTGMTISVGFSIL